MAAYNGMDSSVKALLGAGANKDAKGNVSTSDACDDPLVADDPFHGLRMATSHGNSQGHKAIQAFLRC